MTVEVETNLATAIGNGATTVFDYNFRIPDGGATNYYEVYLLELATADRTDLVEDVDFTIDGIGNENGGSVTYPLSGAPLASTHRIVIERIVSYTQELDIASTDGFNPEVVEAQLDLMVMQTQQVAERLERTPRVPVGTTEADYESLVGDIIRLADSADNIDTVADNISIVNTVATNIADVQNAEENATAAINAANAAQTSETNAAASAAAAADSADEAAATLASSLKKADNLSDLPDKPTARTNLGLGTAATTDASAYATAAQGATADAALPKAGGTMSGNLTISRTFPALILDSTDQSPRRIFGRNNGSLRHEIVLGNGAAESGGNVGTDYVHNVYSDTGTLIGTAMDIRRSDRRARFYGGVQVDGALTNAGAPVSISVSTRTALAGLSTSLFGLAYLNESPRQGYFLWMSGDYSFRVSQDPEQGILVPPASDPTGASGAWFRVYQGALRLEWWGGVGDGVADCATAIAAALDWVRFEQTLGIGGQVQSMLDLAGGEWLTTQGFNLTNLIAWNFQIRNGLIKAHCTGQPVFDLIGSRGIHIENLAVDGDKDNRPLCLVQGARGTVSAFASHGCLRSVTATGWFSHTVGQFYGAEGVLIDKCMWFNRDPDARVYIHEGDGVEGDYYEGNATIISGPTSQILVQCTNSDFRYLPGAETSQPIAGISKTNPAVVTTDGTHEFVNGDQVVIYGVAGMTQVNDGIFTVANATATTFELQGVNSTSYGTYTSGGSAVKRAAKPPVYVSRLDQWSFKDGYIVSFGQPHLEIAFTDAADRRYELITVDSLFEGYGCTAHVRFTVPSGIGRLRACEFKSYKTLAKTSFFEISGSGVMELYKPNLLVTDHSTNANLPLVDDATKYSMYGVRGFYPSISQIDLANFAAFDGNVTDDTGFTYNIGGKQYTKRNDASAGVYEFYKHATPAIAGQLYDVKFQGTSGTPGAVRDYAVLRSYASDITAGVEDGRLSILTLINGTLTPIMDFGLSGVPDARQPLRIPAYTVATLPSAAFYNGCLIRVTDGASNKRLAISDGVSWRWPDGTVVS